MGDWEGQKSLLRSGVRKGLERVKIEAGACKNIKVLLYVPQFSALLKSVAHGGAAICYTFCGAYI